MVKVGDRVFIMDAGESDLIGTRGTAIRLHVLYPHRWHVWCDARGGQSNVLYTSDLRPLDPVEALAELAEG